MFWCSHPHQASNVRVCPSRQASFSALGIIDLPSAGAGRAIIFTVPKDTARSSLVFCRKLAPENRLLMTRIAVRVLRALTAMSLAWGHVRCAVLVSTILCSRRHNAQNVRTILIPCLELRRPRCVRAMQGTQELSLPTSKSSPVCMTTSATPACRRILRTICLIWSRGLSHHRYRG